MPTLSGRPSSLQDLLRHRSESQPHRNLFFYSLGNTSNPKELSYRILYSRARHNSSFIRSLCGFKEGWPVLLHFDDHYDNILWFWSILLARGVPVISTPLSNIDEYRQSHLQHLSSLLESPICITTDDLLPAFDGKHTFVLYTKETLVKNDEKAHHGEVYGLCDREGRLPDDEDKEEYSSPDERTPAFLMLTSGSTGKAKAVCFSHHQVLAAVEGKILARPITEHRPMLNWIGLDHVASLVEIHLAALWADVGQIHVHAADVTASPATFLDLLSRHGVSRSFAPNFFLARLVSALQPFSGDSGQSPWDLRCLTTIISGGEANNVRTCVAASAILQRYGARSNVIVPGFGMTETCAGAIYNLGCPEYDVKNGHGVASLGKCIRGMKMRVSVTTSAGDTTVAPPNELGYLEVCGDVVFGQYYRNPEATSKAFTSDGWFRTGDQAVIDDAGNLKLFGRSKDVTNINGVKIPSDEIQRALEQTLVTRVARVFSFPSLAAHTEQITVVYIPNEWPTQTAELLKVDEMAAQACVMCAGHLPLTFALSKESASTLPMSTLGKVSRDKLRSLFESGVFQRDLQLHREAVQVFRQETQRVSFATNEVERDLVQDFAQILKVGPEAFGLDTPLFQLGCTSMDLIRLKHRIDSRLSITTPVVMFMKYPTVRSLAIALAPYLACDSSCTTPFTQLSNIDYDPVITLRSCGIKTPLWLVHPGVGEVLVFLGLAKHLNKDDRPIYAFRARGFEPGQPQFASITEAVEVYVGAIRRRQAHGPYAIAGYSYGAMLAFEIAKRLEQEDGRDSVRFLGSFNLPPHIKNRMRHLNWNMCLLHLAYFLGLTTERHAEMCEAEGFRAVTRDIALKQVLEMADRSRWHELKLGEPELVRWADVAFGLQSMAVDYDPQGAVSSLDVFHASPLKVAAASHGEWVAERLSKWRDFCLTEPRFYGVGGAHYTMLGPDHVSSFASTLQAALRARGL